MSHGWLLLLCAVQAHALPTQGPGIQWLGINGGYKQDYTDKLGRLWHNSADQWAPNGWGGWSGVESPATYTNTWGSPRWQCKNWPQEYDQDYEALLHHYSKEPGSGSPLSVRANLQQEDAPVSYYTVKWNFCEKNFWGGAAMDFWINGKLVKQGYQTKLHHTHMDMYHFKCIPTVNGKIDLQIKGREWASSSSQGIQARFSTIEFEKTLDGCDVCQGVSCGKGMCSPSVFWDKVSHGFGSHGMTNEFGKEVPVTTTGACHCHAGVSGVDCETGVCAAVSCNEPFGGSCTDGVCSCINGYTGTNCTIKPDTDQFGCYNRTDVSNGRLQVSTLCLSEKIAGPTSYNHIFRGPSPMNTVSDKTKGGIAYFSWTSDRQWGKASNAGNEGRIYISKLLLPRGKLPILSQSTGFDGFVRAGGIDMTEDGHVGTLCSKWFPAWYDAFKEDKGMSAMVLAVCEVESSDMSVRRTPWRIGKQFQYKHGGFQKSTGIWGSYTLAGWFPQRSAGYGQLQYSPHHRTWSAWYGASVGGHTGYAMHTYSADAAVVGDEDYVNYEHPVPRNQVESLVESFGPFSVGGRLGTGDHQAGAAWRYHPILHDIGLQKHNHGNVYMQQYGLETPAGAFAPPGHGSGRVEMTKDGRVSAIQEGSIRPCDDGWIIGFIAHDGNVCAKVDKTGNIATWRVIETSVSKMPCNPLGHNCGDQIPGRMVRIAPLGSAEDAALCGSSARFLYGYEKEDRSRWLVEVDGDCNELTDTRQDVTAYTHWPLYQEWATTRDGAVVWVTSWHTDAAGKFGPKNSPNGIDVYDPQPSESKDGGFLDDKNGYKFGLTPDATNEAKITVYYPTNTFSTVTTSTTTGPSTTTTTTTTTTGIPCIAGYELSHLGWWSNAFSMKPPFGRVIIKPGTTENECAAECNALPGCAGFSLYSNLDCWVYDALGTLVFSTASKACMKRATTETTTSTTTSPGVDIGIQSGDMIFLKTRSGNSKHLDVEGSSVRARWESKGNWQALQIFRHNGGKISSGDTIYLKAHTGMYIDVTGESVQSRFDDKGEWQMLTIEKATGNGAILPNDLVCIKAHTGKHIDFEDDIARARFHDCGNWQRFIVETEMAGALRSGEPIHLLAHTGKLVEVEGTAVQARWEERGEWQRFILMNWGGRVIYSGDAVFLRAHTGKFLDVHGASVQATWDDRGDWQRFILERKDGAGAVMPGDTVFFRAHTGKMMEVENAAVRARWLDYGTWQSFQLERSAARHLAEASSGTSTLAALLV